MKSIKVILGNELKISITKWLKQHKGSLDHKNLLKIKKQEIDKVNGGKLKNISESQTAEFFSSAVSEHFPTNPQTQA